MSREILFKAKRKNWRELPKDEWWVEGDLRQDRDLETAFISGWDYYTSESGLEREPFEYEIDPETFCQYTGKTDKNEKKIWENDIVRTSKFGKDDGNGHNYAGFVCLLLNGITVGLHYLTSGDDLICAQMKKAMRLSETFTTIPNY